jgi:hypothetical protein
MHITHYLSINIDVSEFIAFLQNIYHFVVDTIQINNSDCYNIFEFKETSLSFTVL